MYFPKHCEQVHVIELGDDRVPVFHTKLLQEDVIHVLAGWVVITMAASAFVQALAPRFLTPLSSSRGSLGALVCLTGGLGNKGAVPNAVSDLIKCLDAIGWPTDGVHGKLADRALLDGDHGGEHEDLLQSGAGATSPPDQGDHGDCCT